MAAVPCTVKDVVIDRVHKAGPSGTINRIRVTLFVTNGSTQVAGGSDTLDVDFASIVPLRDGSTLTLRDWSVVQCAQSSSTEYAATGTLSSSKVQLTPKTPADWSTNATVAASALVVPFGIEALCDVT